MSSSIDTAKIKKLDFILRDAIGNMPDGQFWDGCDEVFQTAKCIGVQTNGHVGAFIDKTYFIGWLWKVKPSDSNKFHDATVTTGTVKVCCRLDTELVEWSDVINEYNKINDSTPIVIYKVFD